MNTKRELEKIDRNLGVLSELIAEEHRKRIELMINEKVRTLIVDSNRANDRKEDVGRFSVTWSNTPEDIPHETRGIFFLCDLYIGHVIYIGESWDPSTYLNQNEQRKKHKYDSIAVLSLPLDYYHSTPKVHGIRKGTFHQLFTPKDNIRYSW